MSYAAPLRSGPDASAARRVSEPAVALDLQALVELAREAGMLVILDGQIGRERYESVTGSIATLARFARALQLSAPEAA